MLFLGKGKARFRKTGEVVYVVASNGEGDKRRKTDWVSYKNLCQPSSRGER